MKNYSRKIGTRRNGISLLEILISIGIVTIGLVGVASMIPAAHFKAAQGVRRDRISAMGQRAMDDFLIRGYADPGFSGGRAEDANWTTYIYNGSATLPSPAAILNDQDGRLLRGAYCFDPYSIAWRLNNPRQNNEPATYPDLVDPCPKFPPFPGNLNDHLSFGIPRVCPNDRLIWNFVWNLNDAFYNEEAILANWESVFTLKDDMSFQVPTKSGDPRTQEYYSSVNMGRAKRLNNGEYSWMATLSPEGEFRTMWNASGQTNPAQKRYERIFVSRSAHRYNLSILVFNRRVFDRLKPNQEIIGSINDNPNTIVDERFALPTTLTTFDIEVTDLRRPDNGNVVNGADGRPYFSNSDLGVTFADVKSGEWIGLLQSVGGIRFLKWFKVVSAVDQSPANASLYKFTLTGQAWNAPFPPHPNPTITHIADPRIPRSPIYAIYLNQVVGVQERSIELYAD